jgi:BirA family transcriptional regulator, biotin operon repressor / biotin---[acetyl-CoA-carboxylase] ligase
VTGTPFVSRQESFTRIGSTNDVVRSWLESGVPEVCLAVADEQTAGRGRVDRTWTAPAGAGLLLSVGFRPVWLEPEFVWRLAAIVALSMAAACEEVAGVPASSVRLKWPNDLVVVTSSADVLKLGGVLGETSGLGTDDPRAIVGIGVNADWAASDFPPELAETMTSLRAIAGAGEARTIDRDVLLDGFLERLEMRTDALRAGRFDAEEWVARQLTNGRPVRLSAPDGSSTVRALGVDIAGGGLIVADPTATGGRRTVLSGEIVHLRLADESATGPADTAPLELDRTVRV